MTGDVIGCRFINVQRMMFNIGMGRADLKMAMDGGK